VRWCSFFVTAVLIVIAPCAPAQADDLIIVERYAATLERFDPSLDDARAFRLALRTVTEASSFGLDARLVVALVAVESSWNPRATSPVGAQGLGQLMPGTAAGLGVDRPYDADANLDGTIRHLGGLLARYRGLPLQARFEHAIAAYNAGAGAVDRYDGIPPYTETQAYVRRVIALWRRLAGR
jgi:soluble lytic murein transglycosylase-like protein